MTTIDDDSTSASEPTGVDITRTQPPRAPRTPRRTMPAGHAVLAMLVAFALGSLFNADSMLQTARTQKLGSHRHSLGVALMRPIHAISELLRLDRPRRELDQAIGHGLPPTPKKHHSTDPFAAPSTTSTVAHGTTTTTKESSRFQPLTVSRKRPATIFVAGDSLSSEFGTSLYRIAASRHIYRDRKSVV